MYRRYRINKLRKRFTIWVSVAQINTWILLYYVRDAGITLTLLTANQQRVKTVISGLTFRRILPTRPSPRFTYSFLPSTSYMPA